MRRTVPVHYLRPNHAEWAPTSLIFLDTETRVLSDVEPETLALRCWDAHLVDRAPVGKRGPRDEWGAGEHAVGLARWIADHATPGRATWVFAHNLSFDLTTTRLPLILHRFGWRLTDAAIGGRAPWLRLSLGKRRLCIVDSGSWFAMPLDELGKRLQMAKPPLPEDADDLATWHHRCRADVAIMERAVLDFTDWWDTEKLGRFNVSGAACGWNAFRHKDGYQRMVVNPDPELVEQDRLAVHGGRRGTWSIGVHNAGPFYELDFVSAYPTIAAHLPLPVARSRTFDSLPLDSPLIGSSRNGIIARVRIETTVPRWPVRVGRQTWYPVGEFWADLAGPEIAEAQRLGCLREIGPGQVHRLGGAMMPWARWVLDVQNGVSEGAPEAARIVAKSWGRSVLGKWAARSYEKIALGPSPFPDWNYEEGWDHETNSHGGMVDLAGQRWWVQSLPAGDNTYPAVFAWVESEVRVRLNRAIEAIGDGAILQCDTDGMIVAARTLATVAAHGHLRAEATASAGQRLNWILDHLDPVIEPLQLRVKRSVPHVTVLGPQHLYVGGQRRFAGVPSKAEEVEPGTFEVQAWPKLQWQMAHGSTRGYVRPTLRPTVTGPYPTGWIMRDGAVRPLEARIGRDGVTTLVPWLGSSYERAGARLGVAQHAALEDLL